MLSLATNLFAHCISALSVGMVCAVDLLAVARQSNREYLSDYLVHRLAPMPCGDLDWVTRILPLPV